MSHIYKAWVFNQKAGTSVDEMFFWSKDMAEGWLLGRVTDEMLDSNEYEWGIDIETVWGSPLTMEVEE